MPTQNIFILNGKNGLKPLSPIDFWNLSGRAGRLSKELYGNIFCVQHEDWVWDNKELLNKSEIILKPTVLTKIDRNLQRIEKVLKDESISGSKACQANKTFCMARCPREPRWKKGFSGYVRSTSRNTMARSSSQRAEASSGGASTMSVL